MKLNINLLKIASALALASVGVAHAQGVDAFKTNQYIVGTATNSGATSGNYTFNGTVTPGSLGTLNIAATITTQQEPVSKTTGSSGNEVITTIAKSTTSRINNATLLQLAGISAKGATLGLFSYNDVDDQFQTVPVAVVKSGSTTTLSPISSVLSITDGEIDVTSALNSRMAYKSGNLSTSSESSTTFYSTSMLIGGSINVAGVTTNRLSSSYTAANDKSSVKYTASTAFNGFVGGDDAEPSLTEYTDGADDGKSFNLTVGSAFSISPAGTTENAALGQASWKATGLPAGLSINPLTGVISGKLNTGVQGTVYSVDVTVTNSFGSTTLEDLLITIPIANN